MLNNRYGLALSFSALSGAALLGGCATTADPDAIYFGTAQQSPRLSVAELGQPVDATYGGGNWVEPGVLKAWPVASAQRSVISPFGPRGGDLHKGMDIKAPKDSPVIAVASGKVTFAGQERGYGNVIKIDHGNGYESTYAHLEKNGVKVGDTVNSGATIGTVGATGNASTPHCHFELHRQGKPIDPSPFLPRQQLASAQ